MANPSKKKSRTRRLKCRRCREWFTWTSSRTISPSSRRPRFCETCRAKLPGRPRTLSDEDREPGSAYRKRQARSLALVMRYGVTADEFDMVVEAQGGVCAGCGAPPPASGRPLHADHDHKTGVFRGALCWKCNGSILRAGVTPAVLRKLADYLENPPAVALLGERRAFEEKFFVTDPEIRAVNRAICLLGDEHQDDREAARAALHTIFRRTLRLEAALGEKDEELDKVRGMWQVQTADWADIRLSFRARIAELVLEQARLENDLRFAQADVVRGLGAGARIAELEAENERLREENRELLEYIAGWPDEQRELDRLRRIEEAARVVVEGKVYFGPAGALDELEAALTDGQET